MGKFDISRYAPPGFNVKAEIHFFITGLAAAAIFSSVFFLQYKLSLDALYIDQVKKTLIPGIVMDDFSEILGIYLYGFFILALCMAGMIIFHYSYHHKDSKSIYLMKRLPDRSELHKRCLILPISASLLSLLTAFIIMLIYFGVYMIFTPEQCIASDQWEKIWRSML